MKVRAKRLFKDKREKAIRKSGEEFVVNQERFKELNSAGYGVLVEELQEEKIEETKGKKTEETKDNKSTKEK